ncbi:MAG: hypothetical protein IKK57_05235, partial [Clostridia bacterium]|nr:hypothetical protein [Clostridia bacterium]
MVKRIMLVLLCVLLPLSALADTLLGDDALSRLLGAGQTAPSAQVIDDAGVLSDAVETQLIQTIELIER